MQDRSCLFLSNLVIQGNVKIENEIELILAKMHAQKMINKQGHV